jgi:hypothetical protein
VAPEETIFIYNSLIFNHLNNFVKRLFQQSRISAAWGIAAVFLWSHVSFSGDGESTKFRNWVNAWLCGILIANLCGMVVWRKLRIVLILLIIFSLPILIHFTTPTF